MIDKEQSFLSSPKYTNRGRNNPFCIQQLEKLRETIKNMKYFLKELKQNRIQLSTDIIFKYCGKYQNLTMSFAEIIRLTKKRLNKFIYNYQRIMRNKKMKKSWNQEDIRILVTLVCYFSSLHSIPNVESFKQVDWDFISSLIPGTNKESCMFKALSLKKVKLAEYLWTPEQQLLLKQIARNKQNNWKVIAHELFLNNKSTDKVYRNPKQCKQHWTCFLNPSLKKGLWSIDEDMMLLENIVKNEGQKRWTEMKEFLKGRTQNASKNRFCLLISKIKSKNTQLTELEKVKILLSNLKSQKSKRKYIKEDEESDEELKRDKKKSQTFRRLSPRKRAYSRRQKQPNICLEIPKQSQELILLKSLMQNQQEPYPLQEDIDRQKVIKSQKILTNELQQQIQNSSLQYYPQLQNESLVPINISYPLFVTYICPINVWAPYPISYFSDSNQR